MSFEISSVAPANTAAVQTMTGPSANAPARQKMSGLFDKIDSAGTGSINREQLARAFQTMNPPAGFQALGAGAVFGQLDPQRTGSVSKATFVNTMSTLSWSLAGAAGAQSSTVAAGQATTTGGVFINTTA